MKRGGRGGGGGGGEIVQVQGGHIIRSTGRKDRHSKVYTAKGPRDRRVRLSAHTAIQFYDVQDRLGYDRPSKAVDWLIKKAKAAIDTLAELPPFDPNNINPNGLITGGGGGGDLGTANMGMEDNSDSSGYAIQLQRQMGGDSPSNNESYAPQGIDPQSIADTMKSFFPTSSAANSIRFHNYPGEMIPRGGSQQNQDLCLSLHTFQDQNLIHGGRQSEEGSSTHNHSADHHQGLFPGSITMGFDANSGGWRDHQESDIGQFSKLMAWSTGAAGGNGDDRAGGGGAGGLMFNPLSIPSAHHQQALFGHQGSSFPQRGTLQSSYSPSAWDDLPDHQKAATQAIHQASMSAMGTESDGFMRFCIPSQIHGVVSNKASSSMSPDTSH